MNLILESFRYFGVEPVEPEHPIWSEVYDILADAMSRDRVLYSRGDLLTAWMKEVAQSSSDTKRVMFNTDTYPIVTTHLQYCSQRGFPMDKALFNIDNTVFQHPVALQALRHLYLNQSNLTEDSYECVQLIQRHKGWDRACDQQLNDYIQHHLLAGPSELNYHYAIRAMPYLQEPGSLFLSMATLVKMSVLLWSSGYTAEDMNIRFELTIGAGALEPVMQYTSVMKSIERHLNTLNTNILDSYTIFMFCALRAADHTAIENMCAPDHFPWLQSREDSFKAYQQCVSYMWSRYPRDVYERLQEYYALASALDTDVLSVTKIMTQMILEKTNAYYNAPADVLGPS